MGIVPLSAFFSEFFPNFSVFIFKNYSKDSFISTTMISLVGGTTSISSSIKQTITIE